MEGGSSDDQTTKPLRKKRHSRVSRACDGCRLRKTKCNGARPCDTCEVFERRCIYSSTQAHKLPTAERSRIFEDRLGRARAYIEEVQSKLPPPARCDVDALFSLSTGAAPVGSASSNHSEQDERSGELENMVGNQGRMSSVDHKKAEFYGGFSGFAFLHKTKQFCDEENGYQSDEESSTTQSAIGHLFDSPLPDRQALNINVPISHLLPSRRTASELLRVVFDRVYPLFDFLHEPSFQEQTNRIYEREPIEFDDSDHDFLPLFYVVIGLGFLFSHEKHRQYGCGGAVSQAMRHFIAARSMVDISRCRNLVSLQVLICFVLFLMSTARLATSHTYVGLAVTSAMRLGLSSYSTHTESMPELERDLRQRVFFVIVKLDIYTSQVLGLPTLTNLQELSEAGLTEGVDEVFHLASQPSPEVFSAVSVASSAKHLQLLLIIERMIKRVYPGSSAAVAGNVGRRVLLIKVSEVLEAQRDLKQWRETLLDFFHLEDKNSVFTNISYDLEMVHNFGYIVLYRPFLHYLARARSENPPDKRQLRCALACIKVAESTIVRSDSMLQSGFLSPSSWHSVYTVFLSVVSLIFFLATQPDAQESVKVHQVAGLGVRILASTACQDAGSQRCLDVLRVLARRLSHLVTLDIDKVQSDAESLCRRDWSKSKDQPDASARRTEEAAAAVPGFDRVVSTLTGDPMDFSDMSVEVTTSRPSMAYNGDSSESSQLPPYENFLNPWPESMEQDTAGQWSASAHPYALMDVSSQPAAYASSGTMEIPYSEAFSWPFQTHAPGYNSYQAGTGEQALEMPDLQGPLSSDDIVAFMHLNPGDDPFA